MGLIAPLAALLGLEVEALVSRAKAAAIVYGLIGLFVTLALVFFIVAGYLALADVFGAITAALILGGSFLAIALAVYLGAVIGRGRRQREVTKRRRSSETGALVTTAALTALPALLRAPNIVRLGLPAAALAAYAIIRDQSKKD